LRNVYIPYSFRKARETTNSYYPDMRSRVFLISLFLLTSLFLNSCKEKDMRVSTGKITEYTPYSVAITGRILETGKGAVQYGHCYSGNPNATLQISQETELGTPQDGLEFTSKIIKLSPGWKYYIKAYISNGSEVVYGGEVSFTTPECNEYPVYTGSLVENATPSVIVLNFDRPLANVIPPVNAFTIKVGIIDGSTYFYNIAAIKTVEISGSKVLLTVLNPVAVDDVVRISYSYINESTLQDLYKGCRVPTLNSLNVTNNVH
jgi:hypothetical protein